jgi:ribosomal-protein-alanine N-acetyltransferase
VKASLCLRRARPQDLAALVALERVASLDPWAERQVADELVRGAGGEVLVLEGRGGLRGWCALRVAVGELEILRLAVHPEERRRGRARALLGAALRAGMRAGASRALLEVRASNAAARSLYAHFGFVPIGVRKEYYRCPAEDAVVLARALDEERERP